MYRYDRQLAEDRLRYWEESREERRRFIIVAMIFAMCGMGFMMGALALTAFFLFVFATPIVQPPVVAMQPAQVAMAIPTVGQTPTPTPESVAALPAELAAPTQLPPIDAPVIQPEPAEPPPAPDAPTSQPVEIPIIAPEVIVDLPPTEATAPTLPAEPGPPLPADMPIATMPPVIDPTALPTPTLAPTVTPPQVPSSINSGGLGLSRQDWEARHGAPIDDEASALVHYGSIDTGIWEVSFTDDRVMYVRFETEQPQDREFLQAQGVSFLPADAQLVSTSSPADKPEMTVNIYKSQSLADQLGHDCYCWFGGEPGTAILMYTLKADADTGEQASTSVTVGTGSSP